MSIKTFIRSASRSASRSAIGLATLALATLLAAPVQAQTPAAPAAPAAAAAPDNRPPWVVACDADMKKHCDAELKANGDVRPCLAKHEADLSETCNQVFLRKYKMLELCKDDIAKVCGGAMDKETLGKCFNEKQDQLSEKCRSALTRTKKEVKREQATKPEKTGKASKAAKAGKAAKADAEPAAK